MVTYFVKSGNLLKVGKTKNIDARMFQYALHNPQFSLIGYVDGDHDFG